MKAQAGALLWLIALTMEARGGHCVGQLDNLKQQLATAVTDLQAAAARNDDAATCQQATTALRRARELDTFIQTRRDCVHVPGDSFDQARSQSALADIADAQKTLCSTASNPPPPRPIEPTQSARGQIPEGCIQVGVPTDAGVGCGRGRRWMYTAVKIAPNCPSSIDIEYRDPDAGGKWQPYFLPGPRLQTCGIGVTRDDIRIKQPRR